MELNTPKTSAKIRYGYAAIERTIQINSLTTQAMFATNLNKTEADTIIITTHSIILPHSLSLSAHLVSLTPFAHPRPASCAAKLSLERAFDTAWTTNSTTARWLQCFARRHCQYVVPFWIGNVISWSWARRSSGSKICVSSSAMNDSCRKSEAAK